MALHYIDPTVSAGGSGTLINPYALADGLAALNALSGDLGGDSWLFKAGTMARVPVEVCGGYNQSNLTLGYYGTGDKPKIVGSAIKTGSWTQIDSNTWSIAHTPGFDCFFYGGQASSGAVTQANPYGIVLTPVDTLANCQATSFSNFWSANVMYVNLGGLKPTDVVLEYTAIRNVFHVESSAANFTVDSLRFANGYDANIYNIYLAGSTGPKFLHVETDQGGSPRGTTIRGNCQLIGTTTAGHETYTNGLLIEDFSSTNSFFSTLDLLSMNEPVVHKFNMDTAAKGLGLWNDVINGLFLNGKITNTVVSPFYDSLPGVQQLHYAIGQHGTGSGNNGYSWNNRFSGVVVANAGHNLLRVEGGSLVMENCTLYATSNQATTFPYSAVVQAQSTGGATDPVDLTFSNNVVIFDQPAYAHQPFDQESAALNYIHGDHNVYLSTGAGTDATHWRSVTNGAATNNTFAAWQAAIGSQMDANSVFIAADDLAPSIVNYGTLSTVRNKSILSGFDVTPRNKLDGYAADSQMVGFGSVLYTTLSTPPAAPTMSTAASATSTWGTATYNCYATYVTINGETLASADTTLGISVGATKPAATSPIAQTGAIAWNIYIGTTTTNATKQNAVPIAIGTNWTAPDSPVTGISPPVRGPLTVSPEDANGNPFEPNNMACGAIQNQGACAPSRQKRASGGW